MPSYLLSIKKATLIKVWPLYYWQCSVSGLTLFVQLLNLR